MFSGREQPFAVTQAKVNWLSKKKKCMIESIAISNVATYYTESEVLDGLSQFNNAAQVFTLVALANLYMERKELPCSGGG
jgi:hypothetical protein